MPTLPSILGLILISLFYFSHNIHHSFEEMQYFFSLHSKRNKFSPMTPRFYCFWKDGANLLVRVKEKAKFFKPEGNFFSQQTHF